MAERVTELYWELRRHHGLPPQPREVFIFFAKQPERAMDSLRAHRYYLTHIPELSAQYPERWVAISGEEGKERVVAEGLTYISLDQELNKGRRRRGYQDRSVCIAWISHSSLLGTPKTGDPPRLGCLFAATAPQPVSLF